MPMTFHSCIVAFRFRFEQLINNRVSLPTSENGIYLARTVAPVLTKALAEVISVILTIRVLSPTYVFISEW